MRLSIHLFTLVICIALGLWAAPALQADDLQPTSTPGAVPLAAPPSSNLVPVPDVRGLGEAEASRSLREAGLGLGGIERVSIAQLERELGQRYKAGLVVQQAPRPSTATRPSWAPRGSPIWLRVATGQGVDVTRAPVTRAPIAAAPIAAAPSRGYYIQGGRIDTPRGVMPSTATIPPRPPPPYDPTVRTQPTAPLVRQPQYAPIGGLPIPPTTAAATPTCAFALPCERGLQGWHIRGVGGAALWSGSDAGDLGFYGGIDIGHTFCNCIGVDLFYRYASGSFDRVLPNGLLEDSGDWHNVGLKATYVSSFNPSGRLYWWAGLGAGYFSTSRYQENDDGFAGYGELGIGYLLSDRLRARLGVNVHAMDTFTGRKSSANIGQTRLLWLVAPTLAIEFDL